VLRLSLLLLTAGLAAGVSSFAAVVSLLGWLACGILSFLLPPLMYLVQVQAHYSPEQLARGTHSADWRRRLAQTSTGGERAAEARGVVDDDGDGGGGSGSGGSGGGGGDALEKKENRGLWTPWEFERALVLAYMLAGSTLVAFGVAGVVAEMRADRSAADRVH
jgi:hypothetical protein